MANNVGYTVCLCRALWKGVGRSEFHVQKIKVQWVSVIWSWDLD